LNAAEIHKKPVVARVFFKFFSGFEEEVRGYKSRGKSTVNFNSVVENFVGKVRGSWEYRAVAEELVY